MTRATLTPATRSARGAGRSPSGEGQRPTSCTTAERLLVIGCDLAEGLDDWRVGGLAGAGGGGGVVNDRLDNG